jgi:hypothetical protein
MPMGSVSLELSPECGALLSFCSGRIIAIGTEGRQFNVNQDDRRSYGSAWIPFVTSDADGLAVWSTTVYTFFGLPNAQHVRIRQHGAITQEPTSMGKW